MHVYDNQAPKVSVAPGATGALFRPVCDPGCLYEEDPAFIGTLLEQLPSVYKMAWIGPEYLNCYLDVYLV